MQHYMPAVTQLTELPACSTLLSKRIRRESPSSSRQQDDSAATKRLRVCDDHMQQCFYSSHTGAEDDITSDGSFQQNDACRTRGASCMQQTAATNTMSTYDADTFDDAASRPAALASSFKRPPSSSAARSLRPDSRASAAPASPSQSNILSSSGFALNSNLHLAMMYTASIAGDTVDDRGQEDEVRAGQSIRCPAPSTPTCHIRQATHQASHAPSKMASALAIVHKHISLCCICLTSVCWHHMPPCCPAGCRQQASAAAPGAGQSSREQPGQPA